MQRGLSLMLRDNLLTAAFKALRNVDWSSIVCALTLLTAVSVVLLFGLLATGAEEKPKQQLYEGALKMAAEDCIGSHALGMAYQFTAAAAILIGCMMKLNAWHMWRMLFGWVKTS